LRNLLRQQRLLNLPRALHFLRLHLQLLRALLHRLLQFPVALLQPVLGRLVHERGTAKDHGRD